METFTPETVFLCQRCGKSYRYGDAIAKGPALNDIVFCSLACQESYLLAHHGQWPPIGAEIPLGESGVCNLTECRLPAEKHAREAMSKMPTFCQDE